MSELDLGRSTACAAGAGRASSPGGSEAAVGFVTVARAGPDAQRAFELGAADFVNKPVSPDLLVAKLKQILERGARRQRMPAASPGHSRRWAARHHPGPLARSKTGSLKIPRPERRRRDPFRRPATSITPCGESCAGKKPFYAMLTLTEGEFVLDPNFRCSATGDPSEPGGAAARGHAASGRRPLGREA